MGLPLPVVDVAVGIVQRADGRVLMAERSARQIAAGYWEIPGGKIDPGETAAEAVARELHEEVGIRVQALQPWLQHEHAFPTRRVRLHCFRIERWTGEAHGREGQRIAWVDPARPECAPLLPSNTRLLQGLALPPACALISSDRLGGPAAVLQALPQAIAEGLRLFLLKLDSHSVDQQVLWAQRIGALASAQGARLLLAGTALSARRAGLAGVHAEAAELRRLTQRPGVALWSAECANTSDVERARALAADLLIWTGAGEPPPSTMPLYRLRSPRRSAGAGERIAIVWPAGAATERALA